jgi:hypothetical protein
MRIVVKSSQSSPALVPESKTFFALVRLAKENKFGNITIDSRSLNITLIQNVVEKCIIMFILLS